MNTTTNQQQRSTIIIDGMDFILASQTTSSAITVQQTISRLAASAGSLVISCHADGPLLHNQDASASPLEKQHGAMLTALAHQAKVVLQLRGLSTGAAKDITGILRVSRGGGYEDARTEITPTEDAEWLYQSKGDGSVRLWVRGE